MMRTRQNDYRQRQKELVRSLKDVPCTDCGFHGHFSQMDFDHMGDDKLFTLGKGRDKGTQTILLEVSKCEVVCSNCHRLRTWKRLNAPFV